MKHKFTDEDFLKAITAFQLQYPTSHVGGSWGLKIHGVDLGRDLSQSDLDFTIDEMPENIKIDGLWENGSEPTDFDARFTYDIEPNYYLKIELRVSPEPSFDVVTFNGQNVNVSKKRDILWWKDKYAKKGYSKHMADLEYIKTGKRTLDQYPNEPQTDFNDDLPF